MVKNHNDLHRPRWFSFHRLFAYVLAFFQRHNQKHRSVAVGKRGVDKFNRENRLADNQQKMIEDRPLTDHFTLYELTKTNRVQFQEKNRVLNEDQILKLTEVAKLLEHVRFLLGVRLIVPSAYRCPDLNKALGSSERSQHPKCEAADFIPEKQDIGEQFRKIWKDIKNNGTNVGQLIHETAERDYGVASWIHISLGSPYREESRSKQILRMENGVYTRLT